MTARAISPAALKRLQVLYGQLAHRSFDLGTAREDRLAWATSELKRPIVSFSGLTSAEGAQLINTLQDQLGIRETAPPRRQPKSKSYAQKLGTEGRHDQVHAETTMVDGTEQVFRLIQVEMSRLGMDEDRLKRFLRSRSGPNEGRDTIRTLGDANRVYWALKRIADRQRGAAA